jgi:phage terminase large subunit-like protein
VRGEAGIPDVACSSSEHWFDQRECDRAIFFIQEFCRHVKGPLAGERLRLEPWQKDVTSKLFGWRRANGLRRYRYVWLEVPRKAGKSTFAAAIGLYMLMVDPEPGAEIVIAAANAEHANVCFNIARAGNAIAHVDASGDIRPSKSRSIERIDLLVAALMGIPAPRGTVSDGAAAPGLGKSW